ncbi:GGDEF domain-containing protein [Treponema ruminis]|uniref:Diguanylate cyclase (GGDEF)-like protein n=1 Tax=Treponema ruminis TaxID=744515 RepID=A0A7W8G6T0_9SPIR|nr:GGDEF domain-containing protein [Treponema ruminis]MBB5224865.1 diguanylate cyclase (GGDEF)-like protein [Treponema ruminis]
MDSFFRENEVKTDLLTKAYSQEAILDYASFLIDNKQPFSYVLLNLDNFSYIKDAFGSDIADKVLNSISLEIMDIIDEQGVLGRGVDDDFSIIFKGLTEYDELWNVCHTILVKINELQIAEIADQTLTLTIGLSRYPENAETAQDLQFCAEKALYRGKTKGRNCFVIYIPEKHANIIPKDEKQRALGAMSLHSNVFRFLTANEDLRLGIISLFNFISSYFEVDHLCIQTEKKICMQKIHPLSKNKDFRYIRHDLIRSNMNKLTEVLYISDTKNLIRAHHDDLYGVLAEQGISSTCFCEISYRNEVYGMLRADMTCSENEKRMWRYSEMDLLLTAAKTIALILHYTGKKIENL